MNTPSQQPYFLRALYEWIVDSGYTPYLTVRVDKQTRVPQAYVKEGLIVLNAGPGAVRNIHMDNDWVTFSARFGGASHSIEVPVGNVVAIHARETGEGMSFDGLSQLIAQEEVDSVHVMDADQKENQGDAPQPPRGKPQLKVVK